MLTRTITLALTLCLVLTSLSLPARADTGGLIRDEEIEQTLRIFSSPVLLQAGLTPASVRFVLINRNELNAFVAGGQNIFLFTGLIMRTANPEELVGVIAHETGHIANGDLIRIKTEAQNISVQVLATILLGMAAAVGTGTSEVGAAVMSAAGSVGERQLLRHSRMQETAADASGVAYMMAAQLPVEGMKTFMQKLQDQELLPESQQNEYVRTHPLTSDRVSYLEGAAEKAAKRNYTIPDGWREKHKRMVAKLRGFLFPDQALMDKGTDVAARYGRVIGLYRKGKIDEAQKQLAPLLKEEPRNPYFHELSGQMLFEHGRVEDSLAPYAKAVEYAPRSGLIRTAYAHALMESKPEPKQAAGRLDEAVRQLQMALRTEVQSIQTHHFLAMAYGKQGKNGLSRLHLAEEQLLKGNTDFAIREAKLAQAALPKNSASWVRAADILDAARRDKKNKKKD